MVARRPQLAALICAAVCTLGLALAPAAFANAFTNVLKDYQRSNGRIDPCKHSDKELRQAQTQIPNDIEQYAPDFPAAVATALAARARGDCAGGAKSGGAAKPAGGGTPSTPSGKTARGGRPAATSRTPAPPPITPAASNPVPASDRHVPASYATPAPVIALGVLGALLLATALAVLVARGLGLSFPWGPTTRHAWTEAGWRAGGVWGDFRDWLRLGG